MHCAGSHFNMARRGVYSIQQPTIRSSAEPSVEIPSQSVDSSDSEGETEPATSFFHRRLSTKKDLQTAKCTKEGFLFKHTSSFQRWRRRFFKLKGRKLYYAKDTKSLIFDEIDLTDVSIAECSVKNVNHSFQVITPFRNLVLCADSRKEMEEWILALRSAANREYYEANTEHREMLSGHHNWYACSHARPTYCNVCREALSGVTSHGLSCEVCKFKVHKRCAVKASSDCKWTTLASIGRDIIEDEDGTIAMPHQWLEGNLPVSAKCCVCDKTCGSVLRLQDWRCLWCKTMVHNACKESVPNRCPLGHCRISILPPTAISNLDSDGFWRAHKPPGTSPLLVFVNSKSGDNQGVKMLRKFKQLLNPAQVFDLTNGGPKVGLRLYQSFEAFRVLVCGGDGSIGWVLNEIDTLGLHKQCQVGVLPLGTGNDLARVLGWGAAFDDDTQLPVTLEKLEHAQIKMLDSTCLQCDLISTYEDSVSDHLSQILQSDNHTAVISSAQSVSLQQDAQLTLPSAEQLANFGQRISSDKNVLSFVLELDCRVLVETVKEFLAKVGQQVKDHSAGEDSISHKCDVLNQKLDALLSTLRAESDVKAESSLKVEPDIRVEQDSSSMSGLMVESDASNIDELVPKLADPPPPRSTLKAPNVVVEAALISTPPRELIAQDKEEESIELKEENEVQEKHLKDMKNEKLVSNEALNMPSPESSQDLKHDNDLRSQSKKETLLMDQSERHTKEDGHQTTTEQEPICSIVVTDAQEQSHTDGSAAMDTRWHGDDVVVSMAGYHGELLVPSEDRLCVRPKVTKQIEEKPKDKLMSRANSLKKAIRQIIEHTERVIDEQNSQDLGFKQPPTLDVPEIHEDFVVTPPCPVLASDILITVEQDDAPPSPLPLDDNPALLGVGATSDIGHHRPSMSTLMVPSFIYSSSDGESSACSTPGSLSPVPGRSPEMRRKNSGSLSPQPPKSPSSSHHGASRRLSSMSAFSKSLLGPLSVSASKESRKHEAELPMTSSSLMDSAVFPMLPSSGAGAISSHLPSKLTGGSFISQVLLANADALCAAASPLMAEDVDIDQYQERCVMNNYFGIGLDAKIALEFHHKREEHPEKCRSRTKNLMWYGVIGSKEMVNRTFKNLDQKVQLECDGHRIPLPNLQGIVVLNIASYNEDLLKENFLIMATRRIGEISAVINCLTSQYSGQNFKMPSFDDKILEVVAVFGSVQLGISRVLNLQRHRIAQCRSVKITIMGEEGVPVQVDGEAWVQPPGHIRIIHKNRAQMLTKDKVFEEALKTWTEKQRIERPVGPRHHTLSDTETRILHSFVQATESLIKSVKVASICHSSVEMELFHLATQASGFLDRLYPAGKLSEPAIRTQVSDLVSSVRTLYNETRIFMAEKGQALNLRSDVEEKLTDALYDMENEMKKVYDIGGLPHFQAIEQEATELHLQRRKEKSKVSLMSRLLGKKVKHPPKEAEYTGPHVFSVLEWGLEEVGQWLDSLGMGEYREMFSSHDVRGQELLSLGRTDLKELGIHKVGHLKRIQQGLKDIKSKMSLLDKTATVL